MTQIKLLDNFIELSEDDLRFKVNGGAALSPQQQYELSQQTSQGDFSGYNHLVSDGNTGSSGGTSDTNSGSSQSSSSRSSSNTTRSSNIDQRESSDPSSSSNNTQNPGYNPDYSSYNPDPGKEGENENRSNIDMLEMIDDMQNNPSKYSKKSGNIDERIIQDEANRRKKDDIIAAARNKIGTAYESKEDKVNPYQCDNYVQDVLTSAGVSYKDYLAGDANSHNVDQHIANALRENNTTRVSRYDAPDLADSVYVVMMNEGTYNETEGKNNISHTGFIYLHDGVCTYIDNSSCNPNKGVYEQTFSSLAAFQTKYGYNSFYYQEVDLFK